MLKTIKKLSLYLVLFLFGFCHIFGSDLCVGLPGQILGGVETRTTNDSVAQHEYQFNTTQKIIVSSKKSIILAKIGTKQPTATNIKPSLSPIYIPIKNYAFLVGVIKKTC